MARERWKTLTEQMFYILLSLEEERTGLELMDAVEEITKGRISVGSGTVYHLLDQFSEGGLIEETRTEGRKRYYRITSRGREALEEEYRRLLTQAKDYEIIVKGNDYEI